MYHLESGEHMQPLLIGILSYSPVTSNVSPVDFGFAPLYETIQGRQMLFT